MKTIKALITKIAKSILAWSEDMVYVAIMPFGGGTMQISRPLSSKASTFYFDIPVEALVEFIPIHATIPFRAVEWHKNFSGGRVQITVMEKESE